MGESNSHTTILYKYNMKISTCLKCNAPFDSYSKWCIKKFCSRTCANSRIKTEAAKKQLSDKMVGISSYTKIKYCNCEICNIPFLWTSVAKGSKRHCDNPLCFTQFKYNVRQGKVGGFKPNSTRVHRSIYNGYQMDSGAELVFAQLCDLNNIKWIKNKDVFFEFNYPTGKLGKYYPDFYLPHLGRWIEIKGKKYVREFDSIRQASANAILIMSDKLKDKAFMLSLFNGEGNR